MGFVRQVFTLVLLGMLVACTSGPSESDVTAAVTSMLKDAEGINKLTGENKCGVARGPVTDVTKVEIVERGERNEKEAYWPLRVTVTGKCMAQRPNCGDSKNELCPAEPGDFTDVELEVRLRQDDFKKWQAQAVPPEKDEAASHAGSAPPLPKLAIDPSVVTQVTIRNGDQAPVTLRKDGTTWRLGRGEDAHAGHVEAVLDNLSKLKVAALIHAHPSPDALTKYELDGAKGVQVTVKAADKTVGDMKIGRSGSRGTMTLLDGKVVALAGFSRFLFDRAPDEWKQPTKAKPTPETAAAKSVRMTCPDGATPTAVRLGCMCPGSNEIRNPCHSGGNFPSVDGNACLFQCAE